MNLSYDLCVKTKVNKRNCDACKKYYEGYGKFYCSSKCQPRMKHTEESKAKMRGARGGQYHAIHQWLRGNFGKANHCKGENCTGESKRFEWALIKGKKHEHNKDNYIQLCKICHTKYDGMPSGENHHHWTGGRPNCIECGKKLSIWKSQSKTGLCGTCNRKLNPPWKGIKRGYMPWINPK